MRALDRKLLRDLRRLWSQGLSIALVVAAGIAAFSSVRTTHAALVRSRDAFYATARMPDLWVRASKVPEHVATRLAALPGIAVHETRLVGRARLVRDGDLTPRTGPIVSIPDRADPRLASLVVRTGRLPDPARDDEVALLESFARPNGVAVGDRIVLVVEGTARRVRVVGHVMSPEWVMPMAGADFTPDPTHFLGVYARRRVLAAWLSRVGTFDEVLIDLTESSTLDEVSRSIERTLAPYAAVTLVPRTVQPSHRVLTGELDQLEGLSRSVPMLFLGVSAFLVHVVLTRLLELQRSSIAMLRAMGYGRLALARHYLALVTCVVLIGAALGVGVGHGLSGGLTRLYAQFFHFPEQLVHFDAATAATAIAASAGSAFVGSLTTLAAVLRVPPAVAMMPAVPRRERRGLLERTGLARALGPVLSLVARELRRRPLRALFSALGIAFATAIVVVGRFGYDSITALMDVQFHAAMREDVTVAFARPVPASAIHELAALPGVIRAEGQRVVAARIRAGSRRRDVAVQAMEDGATLRQVVDREGHPATVPARGVLLTSALAELLAVGVGETVELTWLEGPPRTHRVAVTGLADEPLGLQVYASESTLEGLLREAPTRSTAMLRVAPADEATLLAALRARPVVASIGRKRALLERFAAQSGAQMRTFSLILSLFAAVLAVGVVYNNARVALSARERDLASLRVLGFTRAEISGILLGELFVHVLVGVPLGFVLGADWSRRVASTIDAEVYRMPVVIAPGSYALAATVVLAASLASALLVRRRLDHLDLVAVLKTRE